MAFLFLILVYICSFFEKFTDIFDEKYSHPPGIKGLKGIKNLLQCCSIENQKNPFYVVNMVTLTRKNLY